MNEQRVGVTGVGYEGREISEFVNSLLAQGISRVVDVRLTPLSRKRGFSKRGLAAALEAAGIAYDHRPVLGNPKDNRAGFGGSAHELAAAKAFYAELLTTTAAHAALDEIAVAGQQELVALLCFEADEHRCHRDVVLNEVRRRTGVTVSA